MSPEAAAVIGEVIAEPVYRVVVEKMLSTLEGLRARSAVVELPGRHFEAIRPDRAADILLECAGSKTMHDVWTLAKTLDMEFRPDRTVTSTD